MKNTKQITVKQANEMVELQKNKFWSDVRDVKKKLEKRDIKNQVQLPEYCIHNMHTETKQ